MKPKIYAHCPAGCEWETVHKDDFDRSASLVREIPDEMGVYLLDPFKTYKVVSDTYQDEFVVEFRIVTESGLDLTIDFDEYDAYRNYLIFEVLSVEINSGELIVVYEINGNRYSETVNVGASHSLDGLTLRIGAAIDVFAYNSNAEILADPQQVYDTAIESEGEDCPEEIDDSVEYFTKPAATYDGQRTPKVGDFLSYRFNVANSKGQDRIMCKITRLDPFDGQMFVYMTPLYFVQGAGVSGGGGSADCNALIAPTQEEFNSVVTEANKGKTISKNGDLYLVDEERAFSPIEVGETLTSLFLNTDKTPSEVNEILDKLDWTDESVMNDGEIEELYLMYSSDMNDFLVCITRFLEDNTYEIAIQARNGFFNIVFDSSGWINLDGTNNVNVSSYVIATLFGQQSIWGQLISKNGAFAGVKPKLLNTGVIANSEIEFESAVKNESNGKTISHKGNLYLVEGDNNNPIKVGDVLDRLCFDTSKTSAEVDSILGQLEYDSDDRCVLFGSDTNSIIVYKYQNGYEIEELFYGFVPLSNNIWYTASIEELNDSISSFGTLTTVNAQQDIWGQLISKTENFGSVKKAKSISNSLIANSQYELDKACVVENIGKTVSYNNEHYLIAKNEEIKVGDTAKTLYYNTKLSTTEVDAILSKLDWSKANDDNEIEFVIYGESFNAADSYIRVRLDNGEYAIYCEHSSIGDVYTSTNGWSENASTYKGDVLVGVVDSQQEIWGQLISKTDKFGVYPRKFVFADEGAGGQKKLDYGNVIEITPETQDYILNDVVDGGVYNLICQGNTIIIPATVNLQDKHAIFNITIDGGNDDSCIYFDINGESAFMPISFAVFGRSLSQEDCFNGCGLYPNNIEGSMVGFQLYDLTSLEIKNGVIYINNSKILWEV